MNAVAAMSEGTVRPMTPDDVPVVASIERQAYNYPWSERILRDCLRVGYRCRVFELGHDVLGYAIWSYAAGEAHLLNICVAPARHRQGVGRRLLVHVLEEAREAGAESFFLEVRPSNTGAIQLYTEYGFHEIHRRRGYYPDKNGREDAVVMARDLTTA